MLDRADALARRGLRDTLDALLEEDIVGLCKLCGKPAGLFKTHHKECVATKERGWTQMLEFARLAAVGRGPLDGLRKRLSSVAQASFISDDDVQTAMVKGWEAAVENFLDDGNLSAEEEHTLIAFKERFSLPQEALDEQGAFSRVLKGAILRDLLEGKVPDRLAVSGDLPFNFQKSESLIYLFQNVEYLEDRTKTQYVGGYQGVSIRVMKGVYYRVGGFKGNAIQRTERTSVDTGGMGVTTKHIYFSGPRKSFRIRHDKIVTFTPYSDGVGVVRDASTAKPQIFVTGDGWFTYNLLMNVSHL